MHRSVIAVVLVPPTATTVASSAIATIGTASVVTIVGTVTVAIGRPTTIITSFTTVATTTAAAISATASATVATTAAAASTTAAVTVGSVVDANLTAIELSLVEAVLGCLGFLGVGKGNKAEAARLAAISVDNDAGIYDLSVHLKGRAKAVIVGIPGETSHEKLYSGHSCSFFELL